MEPRLAYDVPGLTSADPQRLIRLGRIAKRLPPPALAQRARREGALLTPRRGRGLEHEESRPYQPGDDIRYLDPRVTARRGEPFTKVFREERERPVFICVDDRPAMHFGTHRCFKRVTASQVAALIAWNALHRGERLGALVLRERQSHLVRLDSPRAALSHLVKLICAPAQRTALDEPTEMRLLDDGLERLARHGRSGGLLFLISDFRGLSEAGAQTLQRIGSRMDLVLVEIIDSLEAQLPRRAGRYSITNALGLARLQGGDAVAQQAHAARFAERQEKVASVASALRRPMASIATHDDVVRATRELFAWR